MWKRSCAVGAVALAAAVPTPAIGAVWLSKNTAREIAVNVTSKSCRSVDWCFDFSVAPAEHCRRVRDNTVYCAIAFVTADHHRCAGVVAVKKTRTGRIDRGMAMPMNCSPSLAPSTPV
jgi:hypothetical protein